MSDVIHHIEKDDFPLFMDLLSAARYTVSGSCIGLAPLVEAVNALQGYNCFPLEPSQRNQQRVKEVLKKTNGPASGLYYKDDVIRKVAFLLDAIDRE